MELKLVGIEQETKIELDEIKIHPRETYNDIIKRILKFHITKDKLNGTTDTGRGQELKV